MRKTWTSTDIAIFMAALKDAFIREPRAPFGPTAIKVMKASISESLWKADASISKPGNWNAAMKAAAEDHNIFKADVQIVKEMMPLHEVQTDLLIAEMIRRFSHVMNATSMQDALQHKYTPVKIEAQPQKMKRPIILVVGLLSAQANEAQSRLAGLSLDIRFSEGFNSGKNIAAASRTADCTVCMTKFINHSVYALLKRNGQHLLHCNGGVTDLVKQIKQNFAKQP